MYEDLGLKIKQSLWRRIESYIYVDLILVSSFVTYLYKKMPLVPSHVALLEGRPIILFLKFKLVFFMFLSE